MPKGGNGNGNGNNTIRGNWKDNLLDGTLFDDVILGFGGNDILNGLAGNDRLEGGEGNDQLNGDDGNDTLLGELGDDQLYGGAGLDDLSGGDGADQLFGEDGDDTLSGDIGADLLDGGNGGDVLDGGEGDDQLYGGADNDTLLGGAGDDLLDAGSGLDTGDGGDGFDTAVLSGARDLYTVTQIDAVTVELSGTDGTVTYTNVESFQFADMTQSFDEVIIPRLPNLATSDLTVNGTVFGPDDVIEISFVVTSDGVADAYNANAAQVLSPEPSLIYGYGFAEFDLGTMETGTSQTLSLTLEAQYLEPGTYYIGVVADFDGWPGPDGWPEPGIINGFIDESDETDNLTGWHMIVVEEARHNLSLDGLFLTPGSDLDLNDGATLNVEFDLTNTSNTGTANYRITTVLSEDRTLSPDDDMIGTTEGTLARGDSATVQGSYAVAEQLPAGDYHVISYVEWLGPETEETDEDNVFVGPTVTFIGGTSYGTEGADIMSGSVADDILLALGGDDTILWSPGYDYANGGDGVDTADFSASPLLIEVYDANWSEPGAVEVYYDPAVNNGFERTLLADVEHLIGTDFDDAIYIFEGSIREVDGGAGNDLIVGSSQGDVLNGGTGADEIAGYLGDDTITTGDGADFIYVERRDLGTDGDGMDVITDFDPLEDTLMVGYDQTVETYDPFADIAPDGSDTILTYADGSSVRLVGVDPLDLTADNLQAVPFDLASPIL